MALGPSAPGKSIHITRCSHRRHCAAAGLAPASLRGGPPASNRAERCPGSGRPMWAWTGLDWTMHAVCTCTSSYGPGTSLPTEYRQPSSRHWIGIGSLEEPFQPQCLRRDTIDAATSIATTSMYAPDMQTDGIRHFLRDPSISTDGARGRSTDSDGPLDRPPSPPPPILQDRLCAKPLQPFNPAGCPSRLTELDSGWN
ncbi:hypothetical protein P170DRAFT_1250 [Aspergillus steynii IBT 23096]|uniref:Uncharacterized protein n=1 Tax=Aspergillus steynii IBT 23096 TaxID=1392250 RepID=A0A2I2GL85_9EURO|nr:uncharacterized protein P170DRAFT_1250 [Aspergillus steynii IBT 23096]PLB53645.1 hypothetical protein P170DRAFT_1250 [Aspergillus steynii IBT 23096]